MKMALWTPYLPEGPLDLSTSAKSEGNSPTPAIVASSYLNTMAMSYQPFPIIHHGIRHAAPMSNGAPAISPDSVSDCTYVSPGSSCSFASPNRSSLAATESNDLLETASLSDDAEYLRFEQDALKAMAEKNGGTLLGNNPKMRRAVQTLNSPDDTYRRQRERNNLAAKQSRDRRKLREVRLALQVTYLKKKVKELKSDLAAEVCRKCQRSGY